MKLPFKTLDDVETEGKRVLVRVDINCSVDPDTKKITDDSRIDAIVPTLKELSKSKVVLMAHQGRPGSNDFISLEQHTEILRGLSFNAIFVDDIFGDKAKAAIEKVQVGEILVLQNVRMFEGEMKKAPPDEVAKEAIVQELYPLFDLYVNDAFGAAHRNQCSLVGFVPVLPSAAGRLLEEYPNMYAETAARFGDLASQDSKKVAAFFEKYQDRLMFGSDYGNSKKEDEMTEEELKNEIDHHKQTQVQLQEMNATKDKFFSIISHDLKNPFSSLLSISELMVDNFDDMEREDHEAGFSKIIIC